MMKKTLSLVMTLVLMLGTAVVATAQPTDTPEVVAEESTLKESVVPEDEVSFNTAMIDEEPAKEKDANVADVIADALQQVAGVRNTQSVNAPQASGQKNIFQRIIDFFKRIWAWFTRSDPGVIDSEDKLKEAAAKGGEWKLTKDFTVSSDVVVTADSLVINGNGHKITRNNGDYHDQIIKVSNHKSLAINDVKMESTNGRCFQVNTYARLDVSKCTLISYGDTIVNYANEGNATRIFGGTTITAKASNSAGVWNKTTEKNETGIVSLYYCTIDYVYNEGKLNVFQQNSEIGKVTAESSSKIYMVNGHIGTLTYYAAPLNNILTQEGGTIDSIIGKDIPSVASPNLVWPTNSTNITVLDRYSDGSLHGGIDIEKSGGTDVYAAMSGTVAFAGEDDSYGNSVVIYHDGYTSRYAHLASFTVQKGSTVTAGQKIGVMGSTGESTGTHLHFEFYTGNSRYPGRELRSHTFDYFKNNTSICKKISFTGNIRPRSGSRYNTWIQENYQKTDNRWVWKG